MADDWGGARYGDHIADIYDALYGGQFDTEMPATVLAELARGGRALELGIGTGRIALPLAARGVAVHGIDASAAMVARLRAKPGGLAVPVMIGDFADVGVDGEFDLVYVVFNTFFALLTRDDQVRCFRNVAVHLRAGGVFVIEAFVPDLARFARGQSTVATRVEIDRVVLDVTLHDPAGQRITAQHVHLSESGVRLYPVQLRYAWPSELDLMAQLAGLRLCDRWDGWDRAPFTAMSGDRKSVV